MDITHTSIPGGRVLHQCTTRSGQRFGLLVDTNARRSLVIYDPADPDTPQQTIAMDQDEADQVAELLHSRPILDRLAALERGLAELAEIAGKAP